MVSWPPRCHTHQEPRPATPHGATASRLSTFAAKAIRALFALHNREQSLVLMRVYRVPSPFSLLTLPGRPLYNIMAYYVSLLIAEPSSFPQFLRYGYQESDTNRAPA